MAGEVAGTDVETDTAGTGAGTADTWTEAGADAAGAVWVRDAAPGRHRAGERGRDTRGPVVVLQDDRATPAARGGRASDASGARGARAARGVLLAAAGAGLTGLLFLAYLRVSWTVAATSDGAAQALQARDMLTGNWLLHGWTLADVSFYTTELPEYVLVQLIRPFGTGIIHIAAAATYTLLVLAAGALARGRARGRAGLVQGTMAVAIMLAPQLGFGAFVLLLSPDHTGTELPLLLGWLLLDLAPRRWWVAAAFGLLLAWVQFADRIALLTAVLPLIIACGATVARASGRRWFEIWLAVAAAASVATAWAAARVLAAAGGFTAHPLPLTLAPLRLLWTHARLTGWGTLEVYGANFSGITGWLPVALAAAHLAGLALALAGLAIAAGRFLRPGGGNLIDSVLALAIVANLLGYALSAKPGTVPGTGYDAREIAAVLPLGAVLAGRVLGPPLARQSGRGRECHRITGGEGETKARDRSGSSALVLSLLALVAAAFPVALGYSAARPAVPGQDSVLTRWLVAHNLRYGLGGAMANVITAESGGRARVVPIVVRGGRVRSLLYQSSTAAYDSRSHDAVFLIIRTPADGAGYPAEDVPGAAIRATFGAPARVYRFAGYIVGVWDVNLLTRLIA